MKHRKLRIAWSVAWGVVAVLLCVLWVRSYWWHGGDRGDSIKFGKPPLDVWITSHDGEFAASSQSLDAKFQVVWEYSMPHSGLAFLSVAFATLSWIEWRFSLRTLLIATTLVAVALGLIVWAAK